MKEDEIKKVLKYHDRLLHQILGVLETKKHAMDLSAQVGALEDIFLSSEGHEVEQILYKEK